VFIAEEKFSQAPKQREAKVFATIDGPTNALTFAYGDFPFPGSTNSFRARLACLTFDSQGRLPSEDFVEGIAIIPLARGGILHARDQTGTNYVWDAAQVQQRPPGNWTNNYNFIVVDGLTGRARAKRPEVR
jgi:hypothetical protein